MKNRNEKERKKSWDQIFKQKEGSEPSALVYIGIIRIKISNFEVH